MTCITIGEGRHRAMLVQYEDDGGIAVVIREGEAPSTSVPFTRQPGDIILEMPNHHEAWKFADFIAKAAGMVK